jgi:DNA invertase Pin-like site-specific DNA recombinase
MCVNPDHLFLGTHLDNMRDKVNKKRGRNNVRLSTDNVLEIRKNQGIVPVKKLMEKYSVSRTHIYAIWNKVTWKHI